MTPAPSRYVGSLYFHILNLTMEEVVWLTNKLTKLVNERKDDDDDEEGGAGVREPRRPYPNPPFQTAEAKEEQ